MQEQVQVDSELSAALANYTVVLDEYYVTQTSLRCSPVQTGDYYNILKQDASAAEASFKEATEIMQSLLAATSYSKIKHTVTAEDGGRAYLWELTTPEGVKNAMLVRVGS